MKNLYDEEQGIWSIGFKIKHHLESQLFKHLDYTKCDWVVYQGAILTAMIPRLRQLVWNVGNSIREDL